MYGWKQSRGEACYLTTFEAVRALRFNASSGHPKKTAFHLDFDGSSRRDTLPICLIRSGIARGIVPVDEATIWSRSVQLYVDGKRETPFLQWMIVPLSPSESRWKFPYRMVEEMTRMTMPWWKRIYSKSWRIWSAAFDSFIQVTIFMNFFYFSLMARWRPSVLRVVDGIRGVFCLVSPIPPTRGTGQGKSNLREDRIINPG